MFVRSYLKAIYALRPLYKRSCPICSYQGSFLPFGRPPRIDAQCPHCTSLERHRLFWRWFEKNQSTLKEPILHFAPEPCLQKKFAQLYKGYQTADLFNKADLKLNIEQIDLPTKSIQSIICNHILEHVSDRKALAEIHRVLNNDGIFICSVPLIENWEKTYENDSIQTLKLRELYFGQHDHVRYYGKDFKQRLIDAGFKISQEVIAEGQDVIDYGLLRGESFFVCSKNNCSTT